MAAFCLRYRFFIVEWSPPKRRMPESNLFSSVFGIHAGNKFIIWSMYFSELGCKDCVFGLDRVINNV